MPDFLSRRKFGDMERRRGKFFPFFDRWTRNDKVTIVEDATVVSGGVTLKFATDTVRGYEEAQQAAVEDIRFPVVIAEFAPKNDFDESKHAPTGFTDVTQFVRSINGTLRKRTYELGRFESGSITVELDNHDGRFTPGTARSPYFPDIKANRRFRLRGKNMQNPNVALGGGRYFNTIGYRKGTGTYASSYVSEPTLGTHSLFYLPPGIGTHHVEARLAKDAALGGHDLIEFYAPIELGTRLTHSAYVWKVSGSEAPDSLKEFIIIYYDFEGNELESLNNHSRTYSWTTITPDTPTRVHISDQPPREAKYGVIRWRIWHLSMKNVYDDVVYAITGVQTEVPENNASPLMDSINFTIDGEGNIYENGDNSISIGWGAGAVGASFRVPRMVPGDTYTFAATVKKQGVDLIMTADEGFSGAILDNNDSEVTVSGSFIANRVQEEIKFIPLQPLPGQATNLALAKTVTGSGQSGCVGNETPSKLTNGSWTGGLSDKWCTHASPGLATVDLAEIRDIQGFIVRHARAGGETALYNTKDFAIYVSDDNAVFTKVVDVVNNEDDTTLHIVTTRGRYVKIEVTEPTQIGDSATRIYELEVYDTNGLFPTTSGSVVDISRITVRKGDVTDTEFYPPLPTGAEATAEENGVTDWEEPKPIFEGWTEDWPAHAEDLTSSTSITVNDRAARLGNIELSHTLREALFQDKPNLLLPFDEDPIDSQGKVANLGSWSDTNGLATLLLTPMNRDVSNASYTQGVAGPTTDNAIQFNRLNTPAYGWGYCIPVPFTAQFVPKLSPPSNPEGPLPLPSEGYVHTKNYYATWSHTYKANGALTADDATNPNIYQGDCTLGDAACSGNGDLRSLIGFNYNGIVKDLTGKKLRYIGLSVHAESWWHFTGGYGVFGTHNYTDFGGPVTWSASRVEIGRWRTPRFRRDSWQTFSLGVEAGYELVTGTATGISVGPALSTSLNYYGWYTGAGLRYKPYLTVQYVD